MGILETDLKKEIKRTKVRKIILRSIAAVGLMSVAVVAPNVIQVLKLFEGNKKRKTLYNYRIQTALSRLIRDSDIRKEEKNQKMYFELTEKGRTKLGELYKYQRLVKKPKKWDGKWRIVSFDIYEKRRSVRDKFRYT